MDSMHYEDLCERMKNYRKKLGFNQTEMGKRLGISQDDIQSVKMGILLYLLKI